MTPWVQRLLVANVGMFFLQLTAPPAIMEALVFQPAYVFREPWTIVTYMFLHGGMMHLLFNMLGLYFFGPRVEERLGSKKFITLYLISGISGAILSFIFAPRAGVVGASAAVFGVMLAFARFWPDVQILLMFFIPVPVRVAVIIFTVMSIYSGIQGSRSGVADFAHLGGFVGAFIYLKYLERKAGVKKFRTQTVAQVGKEVAMNFKRVDPKTVHPVNRDEVNRILDKISASGLNSLTAQEKLFLSNFVPPDDRVPPPVS